MKDRGFFRASSLSNDDNRKHISKDAFFHSVSGLSLSSLRAIVPRAGKNHPNVRPRFSSGQNPRGLH